ncbi:DUF4062 domain-containing protein [Paenibacillus oceani]|uniref:DUF4062 domain-containing protein n=1 Tax=Paenibacillus oceani TaxID=2772510 RepID=A0A927GYJ3_9BACL|nr:DUF4062 domain-containing protein [Paenibacillus oceani]MBD2860509.1 DUF4062 domain-containing protein [Paenibacillus oceani]
MLRIFISSTIRDLHFVRASLAGQIESTLGHKAVASESIEFNFTGSGNIIESCLEEIDKSDVYVLVIGERYGSIVSEWGISITHAEYRHALAARKPVLVIVMNRIWILYQDDSPSLEPQLKQFIDEVSSHFARNVKPFDNADDAFGYIRAQLSILLKNYVRTGLNPLDVHDIMRTSKVYESANRFFVSLMENSQHASPDYARVLSVFIQELQTGEIRNHLVQIQLSQVTGATLYKLSADGERLVKLGSAGNVGGKESFGVGDTTSYVCQTYISGKTELFEVEKLGFREYIICIPISKHYIVTLHCFLEKQSRSAFNSRMVLDEVTHKNQVLLGILALFLERV